VCHRKKTVVKLPEAGATEGAVGVGREEEDESEEEEEDDSSEEEEEGDKKGEKGDKTEDEDEEGGSDDDGSGQMKLVVSHGQAEKHVTVAMDIIIGKFKTILEKEFPVYAKHQNLYIAKEKKPFSSPGDNDGDCKLRDLLGRVRDIRMTKDKNSIVGGGGGGSSRGGKGGKGGGKGVKGGEGGVKGVKGGEGGGKGGEGGGKGGDGGGAKKRKTDSGAGMYKGHEVVTYDDLDEDPWDDLNKDNIPLIAYFKARKEWFPIKGIWEVDDEEGLWEVEWFDEDTSDIMKEAHELARDPSVSVKR
jgi:hypothetical protein